MNDDEAIDWAIRMADPDADWDAFTIWLEGDARRSERYDRAVFALAEMEATVATLPVVPRPVIANGVDPIKRSRPRWLGGALAAALVGAVGLGIWHQAPRPYDVETAAGEQRTIVLADGSSIVLAGESKVRLDRGDTRIATVTRGELLFRVRHDAARPFAVQVGDLRLVDLGTVFDVKMTAGRTRVAVARGAVMVDPDGAALRLDPGQAVIAEGSSLRRHAIALDDVGAWQQGRLAFDGVSLEEVAADLSRQLGRSIRVSPAIAGRSFRGTLDAELLKDKPALLGELLGVAVRQDAGRWTLEPHR